jgi:hypothetical protein
LNEDWLQYFVEKLIWLLFRFFIILAIKDRPFVPPVELAQPSPLAIHALVPTQPEERLKDKREV